MATMEVRTAEQLGLYPAVDPVVEEAKRQLERPTLGNRIMEWVREKLRQFLGVHNTDAQLREHAEFLEQMAKQNVDMAKNMGLTSRRLCWHEQHSEVLRASRQSWDKHVASQGNGLSSVVAEQVKEKRRILLLNDPGKLSA